MNSYPPVRSHEETIFHRNYIGSKMCSICEIRKSTQIKLLHEFDSHGFLICDDNNCVIFATEQIDNIYQKYPIYKLSLDRNDLKNPYKLSYPYNFPLHKEIEWSTLSKSKIITFQNACVGLTYLIEGKWFTTIITTYFKDNNNYLTYNIELEELYKFNNIDMDLLPDPVKEYLGISSFSLKFVD